MLDQNTIDKINDAARIQDVVSDYVTLRKRGANMIGLCPFHNEKTPSFSVSPAKGIFKCFGCGKGGNAIHFIMEHEQINYYEALKFLAKKYHIEFKEVESSAEEMAARNDRESMFLVNEFARNYFSETLHQHIDGKSIGLGYFRERGFRDDIVKKFELGYSLEEKDAFSKTAVQKGYSKDFLVKTGLSLENDYGQLTDRFRGRVMFPVHSLSGKVVAFGGRILRKDDKMAKYVNSPESEIYHKSNELYGIFFAKKSIVKEDRCFLVEGYTDVISMHQNGIENVVASSGTALTPGQIRLIHRFTENVTVIYDGDAAGIKASIRGIDLLLEEGLNIRVLLLPDGDDPDSFARKHNASDFIEYVEKNSSDFIRFKVKLLLDDAGNDPIKRAALINDIVKSIAIIPNAVIRAEYVKQCSNLMGVEEAMLYHEINKLKSSEQQKRSEQQAKTESAAETEKTADTAAIEPFQQHSYDLEEKNILQVLIKYGKNDLVDPDAKKKGQNAFMKVADFILEELNRDNILLFNPVHERIKLEYEARHEDENFDAEKFFLYHPDPVISKITADLISEKYTLSKIHSKLAKVDSDEDRLFELVPRFVYEFKNRLMQEMIKGKLLALKQASEQKMNENVYVLMQELNALKEIEKQLAKNLGTRVLNRI
jgi:DNA primase